MYEKFYGFTARPFLLNADPSFYFGSTQHRRAMAYIQYGLHQNEGFVVVTGEVGAGKTTLVRSLLAGLDPEKMVAAHLVSTQLDAEDTLRMVAAGFGVQTRDRTKADLLLSLEAMLAAHTAQGRRCLLIVDEAQNLTERAVEELRMLSNFQLGTHALLQTFLVGQPELRLILQGAQMHQLRQRVIAACHIGPLAAEETRSYIEHRLAHVGWKGNPQVCAEAFAAIQLASGGIPRRINLVCDRLLISGFLSGRKSFGPESVREIAQELTLETGAPRDPHAPAPRATPAPAPADDSAAHLENIEKGMRELETMLSRLDRGSQESTVLMRRFLDLIRKSIANRSEH